MVLDEVPAQDSGFGGEVWVRLDTAESSLRCGQGRCRQADAVEVRDRLGRKPEDPLGDEEVVGQGRDRRSPSEPLEDLPVAFDAGA